MPFAYTGCYSEAVPFASGDGKGVEVFRVDPASGSLDPIDTVALINPTYVCSDTTNSFLYAVCERYDTSSTIHSFKIDVTGKLEFVNKVETKGKAGCFVMPHPSNNFLAVSNYMDSSVCVYRRDGHGALQEPPAYIKFSEFSNVNPERQEASHAHMAMFDPSGKFLIVPDLGADVVRVLTFDATDCTLTKKSEMKAAPGSGPRHARFSKDGKHLYVVNELLCTVVRASWDAASGELTSQQVLPVVPADTKVGVDGVTTCAALRMSDDGRFLYISNRGLDSVSIVAVQDDGSLVLKELVSTGGLCPRDICLFGAKLYATHQNSNDTFVFDVDTSSGSITPTDVKITTPCIAVLMVIP